MRLAGSYSNIFCMRSKRFSWSESWHVMNSFMNRRQRTFFKKISYLQLPSPEVFSLLSFYLQWLTTSRDVSTSRTVFVPIQLVTMEIFAFPSTNKPWFVTQKFCFAPSQVCLSACYSQWKIHENVPRFKHKFIGLRFSCLFPFLFSPRLFPFFFSLIPFPHSFLFLFLTLYLLCLVPCLVMSFPSSDLSLCFVFPLFSRLPCLLPFIFPGLIISFFSLSCFLFHLFFLSCPFSCLCFVISLTICC